MKVLRTNTEIKELKEELSTERKKRQEAEEKVNDNSNWTITTIIMIIIIIMFFKKLDNFIKKKKLLKSYLQLIRLKKKEKTIHSKTLFTISVDLKST